MICSFIGFRGIYDLQFYWIQIRVYMISSFIGLRLGIYDLYFIGFRLGYI